MKRLISILLLLILMVTPVASTASLADGAVSILETYEYAEEEDSWFYNLLGSWEPFDLFWWLRR